MKQGPVRPRSTLRPRGVRVAPRGTQKARQARSRPPLGVRRMGLGLPPQQPQWMRRERRPGPAPLSALESLKGWGASACAGKPGPGCPVAGSSRCLAVLASPWWSLQWPLGGLRPALREGPGLQKLPYLTALPLGSPEPRVSYGWGRPQREGVHFLWCQRGLF